MCTMSLLTCISSLVAGNGLPASICHDDDDDGDEEEEEKEEDNGHEKYH